MTSHGEEYQLAVEPLDKSTYVDDVLFGADTKSMTIQIRNQVEGVLQKGGLDLRKWASNCADLSPNSDEVSDPLYIEPEDKSYKKILGISWNPKDDLFTIQISNIDTSVIKKSSVLSHIARLYDPLGWLSPFIVKAKILMQDLWRLKTGWDETFPQEERNKWLSICQEMEDLQKLNIPRFIGAGDSTARNRLIGFSDASKQAYSAAVYLVIECENGGVKSNLLSAKTRVAPIQTLSILRLELCGAALLTKLMFKIKEAWLGPIDDICCFTDSRIVLDWLNKHASTWKTFVANRVSYIQTTLPDAKWCHITSKQNPDNLNSRGLHASELLDLTLRWHHSHFT